MFMNSVVLGCTQAYLGPNHDRVLIVGHNTELIGSMNKKSTSETKSGNRLYWARQKSLAKRTRTKPNSFFKNQSLKDRPI